jgi:hypothetical protein
MVEVLRARTVRQFFVCHDSIAGRFEQLRGRLEKLDITIDLISAIWPLTHDIEKIEVRHFQYEAAALLLYRIGLEALDSI